MKEYRLADTVFRKSVDLRTYAFDIIDAVKTVKKGANVVVTERGFIVYPELGKLESIAVSKILREGRLKPLTMYRPCLFNGYKIDEEDKNGKLIKPKNRVDNSRYNSERDITSEQKKDTGDNKTM